MALEYKYVLPGSGYAENFIIKEMLDDIKLYVDALAPSGTAAPATAKYVTLATDTDLTQERVLTGTTGQVVITDNGAGSTVVLSLPQSIAVTSSPSFAAILYRNSSGNTVTIQPPSSFSNYTLTLPTDDGASNQYLQTNGSGVLSWVTINAGVTSATGTVNQVLVNGDSGTPHTGDITLTLPQDIDTDSDVTFNTVIGSISISGGRLITTTVGDASNPSLTIYDSNTGFWRLGDQLLLGLTGSVITTWDFSELSLSVPVAKTKSLIIQGTTVGPPGITINPPATFSSYTLTLPDTDGSMDQVLTTDGSGVLSWTTPTGTGANTALSNLGSVAINTTLVSDTNNTDDLGSSSIRWKDLYLSSSLNNSATSNQLVLGTTRTVTVTAPTPASSSRTVTLPDLSADYSVVGTEGTQTINGAKTYTSDVLISYSGNPRIKIKDTGTGTAGIYMLSNNNADGSTIRDNNKTLEMFVSTFGKFLSVADTTGLSTFSGAINVTSTGSSTFGPSGSGTNNAVVILDGGSGTAAGAQLRFSRNTTLKGTIGHYGSIFGGTSDDLAIYSVGNNVIIDCGGTDIATFTSTEFYTVAYTDYSSSSTVTGWTTFNSKKIYYKKIGKLVFVWFSIDGTSNATTVSFTLPFTVANTVDPGIWIAIRARDNNVDLTTPGHAECDANSSTVNCYKDAATGAWTNSNRKIVGGQFVYQTT